MTFDYVYFISCLDSCSNLKTERKIIHMNLIVALALAQITYVVGIDMTYDDVSCTVIAALLHYFYTATFTWMLCEGVQLYLKVIAVFSADMKYIKWVYYIIGWGEYCGLPLMKQTFHEPRALRELNSYYIFRPIFLYEFFNTREFCLQSEACVLF